MSDAVQGSGTTPGQPVGEGRSEAETMLFAAKAPEESRRGLMVMVGAAALLILAIVLVMLHGRQGGRTTINAVLPADAYAGSLELSDVAMSESTSLSGGKSTFIDGKVKNLGTKTVTGVTVQVLFHNDEGLSPQVETLPLSLIRTHEPYIDTVPVSAAPLKQGDQREFRLIFETIPENWNQQTPEIHLVKITAE